MFKIKKEDTDRFTVECHIYNKNSNLNNLMYSIANLSLLDLAPVLQRCIPEEAVDDVMTVLKLTNRPAFVSDLGVVSAVS